MSKDTKRAPESPEMNRDNIEIPKEATLLGTIAPAEEAQLHPGLHMYVPVASDLQAESDIMIAGTDFHQMLQVLLKPGQVITAQPGSLTMMSGELAPGVESGGCGQACTRCCCAGESIFRLSFENKTPSKQFIALSPSQPGKIIPINLDHYSGMTLKRGSFLGAIGRNWRFKVKTVRNVGTGCCGGQGFFLSELYGRGTAFIHAMGTVETLRLKPGEQIVLDNSSLVAFEKGIKYDIRRNGGCLMCCCGRMGLYNVVLTGPGLVIVQSLSMERLRRSIGVGRRKESNNSDRGAGRGRGGYGGGVRHGGLHAGGIGRIGGVGRVGRF